MFYLYSLTAMGFPGYAGRVPQSAQEVSRVVRDEGWTTYAIGKWDHTPLFQVHQVGPFTYWPTNDGFDHTYNFMSADINNFTPVMYAGHEPVEPSRGKLDNTLIILTSDNGASAEGGVNGSHNEVLYFNGVAKTDMAENLKKKDSWGSEETDNHYDVGWAWAGNTPHKYFKQTVHHGGIADPLIVHWPAGIKAKGEIRDQFAHIIDIGPTIMEALGVTPPAEIDGIKQSPFEGTSMAYTFNEADAPERHTRQYFEQLGNRAMYLDGWVAVTLHADRVAYEPNRTAPFEDDVWELYHVAEDRSQSKDLAKEYPEKLEELKQAWDEEALKYNVYPLHDDLFGRLTNVTMIYAPQRKEFVFYPPGAVRIPEACSPQVKNKNHTITAYAEIPKGGASGVLVASGGIYSGYSLYVKDNHVVYHYNAYNEDRYTITGTEPLPEGEVVIEAKYTPSDDKKTGTVTLSVNGKQIGSGKVGRTAPGIYSISETFDVGQDTGSPVSKDYDRDNEFSGTLDKVVFNLD